MHRYTVKYEENGEIKYAVHEGSDSGHAMEKAIKAGLTPISAMREGKYGDGYGFTEWKCPSMVRVEPLPEEKADQLVMEL